MSLARRIVRATTGVLLVALLGVGAATAAVLHAQAGRATDQALLAAAHAGVPDRDWEVEHVASPVEVRIWRPGDPDVDPRTASRAGERPTFLTTADRRVLLVEAERDDDDVLVVASAARPTPARTVGPFLLVYGVVALLAGAAAAGVQSLIVRRAVAPVARASAEVARVAGAGSGARVDEAGPDEIRGLLAAVNALLGRLDHAFLAQSRFTAEAAHELRSPVAAMLGELDVALRRPRPPEEYARVLASVREDVERLGRLVEGLMALARVDAGQAEQGRGVERAADLARRALALERAGLDAAGCEVSFEADDSRVLVQEPLVVAALANLLRNAAVHAPGAPVALRVARAAGLVRFEIADGGPGVADPEAVFDRFARGGEARRGAAGGLGLGLPLAREVARRHGGDCFFEAPARVVLTLPAGA